MVPRSARNLHYAAYTELTYRDIVTMLLFTVDHTDPEISRFEMAPSVNFISLVTSCVRLRDEEPQMAFPMSFT